MAALLLGGCAASGPKHSEIRDAIAPVEPEMGRIFFYRDSFAGFAIQPEIRLNGEVVGKSTPGGFFFVDRRPGKCVVSSATEVENSIEFSLAAGQNRYVRTYISLGVLVGRIQIHLVDPDQAATHLGDLSYTGDPSLTSKRTGRSTAGAESASARTSGGVAMDDLKDLLPKPGVANPSSKLDDFRDLLPAGSAKP
jgi:hypothetical protein